MPAHCKKGLHLLYQTGYTAREVAHYPDFTPYLVITCHACTGGNHSWTLLSTHNQRPDVAEFDDAPYAGIEPCFGERPASPPT